METEASLSGIALTVFNGSNYQLWAVRMEAYLEALDLWEAVEEDYEIPVLPNKSTMTKIRMQKEKKRKRWQRERPACLLLSRPLFSQESCP